MTMNNDIFGDGEVLGAIVTCLVIVVPILAIVAYDKYKAYKKEQKRLKILSLCGEIKDICRKITNSR